MFHRLWAIYVLPERGPFLLRKNISYSKTQPAHIKIGLGTAPCNPLVPFPFAAVSRLILVESHQKLLVSVFPKSKAIVARILQNRRDVIQAVDHVADQR